VNSLENPEPVVNSLNHKFDQIKSWICDIAGHRWRYKDYSNFMKANGDPYDFEASRTCTRCNQYAYFYKSWKNEEKSVLDCERDFHSSQEISINTIIYS